MRSTEALLYLDTVLVGPQTKYIIPAWKDNSLYCQLILYYMYSCEG
jgi:hypothetical protein